MKSTISNRVIKQVVTFAAAIVLIIATVSAVPFSALAQEGGVTTPTPSNDPADDPYDCGDFDNREQVEAVFEAEEDDQSGLDDDGDGTPCESIGNPTETTETDVPTATPTEEPEDTETPTDDQTDTPTEEDTSSDDTQTSDDKMSDNKEESENEGDREETADTEKPPC